MHHLNMDTYPFTGPHAATAGRTIRDAITGPEASMPKDKPGSLQGSDLALVLQWADAFDHGHPAVVDDVGGDDHDHAH